MNKKVSNVNNNTKGGKKGPVLSPYLNPNFIDLTGMDNKTVNTVIECKGNALLAKENGKMAGIEIVAEKIDGKKTNNVLITNFITALPENGYTRGLGFNDAVVSLASSTYKFTKEDRFSDSFFAMKLDKYTSQMYAMDVIYADFTTGVIALPNGNNEYTNIVTGKKLTSGLKKLNAYRLALQTASGLRESEGTFSAIYYKVSDGNSIGELLNECCFGIIDLAPETMSKEEASKFATRPGLRWSASKNIGKIGAIARYYGVFDTDRDDNTFDGVAYATDELIAKLFNCTKRQARELVLQARPGGVIKVQLKVVSKRFMKRLCKQYEAEKAREIAKTNSEKRNPENVFEIFGGNDPQILIDSNSIKAEISLEDLNLEVMAFGKTTVGSGSKQLYSKGYLEAAMMDSKANNNDATNVLSNYILDMGKAKITEIAKNIVQPKEGYTSEYVTDLINQLGKISIPACKRDAVQSAAKQMAKLINKLKFSDGEMQFKVIYTDPAKLFGFNVLKDGEIYVRTAKGGRKGLGIKFPSVGAKEFISFTNVDFAEIKKRIEALNCDDELKEILIDEYKLMASCNVVLAASRKTYDACAGLDIDMDTLELVFSKIIVDILHGKEEFVQLIAKEKVVKTKVQDEAKNALVGALGVSKGKATKETTKESSMANVLYYPKEEDFMGRNFMNATSSAGKSIGAITYDNDNIGEAVRQALLGNFAPMKQLLLENFGIVDGGSKVNYVGLPINKDGVKVLSEKTIDEMIAEIKQVKLTNGNLILIGLDMQRCERLYQETAIDAAKTGIAAIIRINCNSIVAKSQISVVYKEDRDAGTFEIVRAERTLYNTVKSFDGQKVEIAPILIEDEMAKVQDQLIEFAMATLTEALPEVGALEYYGHDHNGVFMNGSEIATKLVKLMNAFATKNPEAHSFILTIKKIYGSLAFEYGQAMSKLEKDKEKSKDTSEVEKEVLRNQFDSRLSYLSNTVELLLTNMVKDADESAKMRNRGAYLTVLASLDKKGNPDVKSTNKFALNVASHYALAFAMQNNHYVKNHEVLFHDGITEGKVDVVRGIAEDRSIIVKGNFEGRKERKGTIDVEMDLDGNVTATETVMIERPEYDASKAVMIVKAEIENVLDVKGNPVKDASGTIRTQIKAIDKEGNKTHAKIVESLVKFGKGKVKVTSKGIEVSYVLNGETKTHTIPTSEVLTDAKHNTFYDLSACYLTRVANGSLIVELNR